jgi:hypothetical protein
VTNQGITCASAGNDWQTSVSKEVLRKAPRKVAKLALRKVVARTTTHSYLTLSYILGQSTQLRMSYRSVFPHGSCNKRHSDDNSYELPQSDSQIYLDQPVKRRHVHAPDIDLPDLRNDRNDKFERSKKFCRDILRAGLRKFSPNSLEAAKILIDKIHDYNGKRKMGDPREIEVFSNIMAQRYTELHGEEGICQKLIDQADSAIERRLGGVWGLHGRKFSDLETEV